MKKFNYKVSVEAPSQQIADLVIESLVNENSEFISVIRGLRENVNVNLQNETQQENPDKENPQEQEKDDWRNPLNEKIFPLLAKGMNDVKSTLGEIKKIILTEVLPQFLKQQK